MSKCVNKTIMRTVVIHNGKGKIHSQSWFLIYLRSVLQIVFRSI